MTQTIRSEHRASPIPADALVLHTREIRDDVLLENTSRFADEIWVLSPAIHQVHQRNYIMNFPALPHRFRHTAKELFYTLLTGIDPPPGEPRYGLATLRTLFTGVKHFLIWADLRDHATLQSLTSEQLAQFQTWMLRSHFSPQRRAMNRRSARLFWLYRDLLPSDRLTHDPRRVANWAQDTKRHPGSGENKTDRIPEAVISPLLVWAFRWVDDFSSDILAARREWWPLHANGVTTNSRGGGQANHHRPRLPVPYPRSKHCWTNIAVPEGHCRVPATALSTGRSSLASFADVTPSCSKARRER